MPYLKIVTEELYNVAALCIGFGVSCHELVIPVESDLLETYKKMNPDYDNLNKKSIKKIWDKVKKDAEAKKKCIGPSIQVSPAGNIMADQAHHSLYSNYQGIMNNHLQSAQECQEIVLHCMTFLPP